MLFQVFKTKKKGISIKFILAVPHPGTEELKIRIIIIDPGRSLLLPIVLPYQKPVSVIFHTIIVAPEINCFQ